MAVTSDVVVEDRGADVGGCCCCAVAVGDKNLALICSKIAGDESRHEKAYQVRGHDQLTAAHAPPSSSPSD